MNRTLTFIAVLLGVIVPARAGDPLIVENGQSRAEIVIAEKPLRSVRLAADDLQTFVQKISGARLPIVTEPSGKAVKLFVGRSAHTEKLGVTADGLNFGAYRLASGPDWMAFIGEDSEFTPIEPWAKSRKEITSEKFRAAWDKVTGNTLGHPQARLANHVFTLPADIGAPDATKAALKGQTAEHWDYDERGSLNAVCGFLMRLGVRWYLPGKLGEVVPQMKSISLPKIDETVRPDFEMRRFSARGGVDSTETTRWMMRLGVRDPYEALMVHGLSYMCMRDELYAQHPEFFALYGGKRDYEPGSTKNKLCLSNEALFQTTVDYVRRVFDHYHYNVASVMPPDGFTSICQCPLCQGKDQPERGSRGSLSNHVWDFVNRVAKEVGKTHPDKFVTCSAYGANYDPPTNIDKLEPNVLVSLVGGRRPKSGVAAQAELRAFREAWQAKTNRPIAMFENYPFTNEGYYLPTFMARTIVGSINETKGHSIGEDVWLSFGERFQTKALGFNHHQVYFTARSYWGGQLDAGTMLEEYCRLFYGPAAKEMQAFFDYCEPNWQDMSKDKAKADEALALFDKAKATVEPASLHGRRIALIDDFLNALRRKTEQLAQKRGPVPQLRFSKKPAVVKVDGKLDDAFWQENARTGSLRFRETQTGRLPAFGTTVTAGWRGEDLYLAIRCDERSGDKPTIGTTKPDDTAIWQGDCIEVLISTDAHSYYQLVVNPAGALLDYDRGVEEKGWAAWTSQAEVATSVANDHWIVEMRIPASREDNDPLHQVIGRQPIPSLPWHINICRQRVRANGSELSAISPTGTATFQEPAKFAHFFEGRHNDFDFDRDFTDFLIASEAAQKLADDKKNAEAIAAFVALADGKVTDLQKSFALAQAAAIARGKLKDTAQADALTARIPVEAIQKTAMMQNLLAQRKHALLIEQFASEDLTRWPFWAAGEAYATRGRAYAETGDKAKSEADFTAALSFNLDKTTRDQITKAREGKRQR
ncbi:MAG: DUF4838 domain-containing protein [Prosthecobacter sp.]|jgi:hypothetical protein|uniref:DUF4838 domain-containing protein n=1 Tax=Prosthecobacter sp. TaxID=1965333 RepID=UPI0019DC5D40|nr:DUF4838 domain-containing protein [Prosthecobacter sp.]MBE2284807.1 DUF4838 domain-containing protein [Prosthecobacter sp.]